ncbi:Oidioi.mRNA.OKI2018_I69.chr1.g3933.t1.cds [Oikopleura dioica]|uniref:Oidioi.mRNA.OKI2018_I69.chr1.g3933.t1.cds n=1 Tax=Oikopleura dioica TaxID=34765 RepID=A0ABN7SVR2_OIKDI|nr:Oidioi.mRNA.OKI2018_I69.chr1.g3933.t1.cds [Oikopleura dioica]
MSDHESDKEELPGLGKRDLVESAEPPVKKRRKKKKRGRVLTVDDMPRKVREEFRTDQKAEKFLRLLGGLKPENVHANLTWMRRCKTEKLPSKDQLAWLEMKQWEQDSDDEELLELPSGWMERDEEPEEYMKVTNGRVEFSGKTYIKVSVMYGGGSQLDPRDAICDPTPMSEIEAQIAAEEAEDTDDDLKNPDQPKPMPMTAEEQEAARLAKQAKLEEEIREKEEEITTAKLAAETMYRGMGVEPGEENSRSRRRQEIHWDYDHKAEPDLKVGSGGVNKFISDSYGYGGYRESEMARDQWKDLSYDQTHGQGASKYRKSAYDNWDQDFEQKYKWEDFATKWAIKRKEMKFYNRQHHKYEDITDTRKQFLEKEDKRFNEKRVQADVSYWAQAAAQASMAVLAGSKDGKIDLQNAPWMKQPAPAPSNEDPRKRCRINFSHKKLSVFPVHKSTTFKI